MSGLIIGCPKGKNKFSKDHGRCKTNTEGVKTSSSLIKLMSHESRIKKFLNTWSLHLSCRTRKAKLNLNVVEVLEENGDVRLDSSLGSTVARRSVF